MTPTQINEKLTPVFDQQYKSFWRLLTHFRAQIISTLAGFSYHGPKHDLDKYGAPGYPVGEYESFLKFFNYLFPEKNDLLLTSVDDNGNDYVSDIQWAKIQRLCFEGLQKEHYIQCSATEEIFFKAVLDETLSPEDFKQALDHCEKETSDFFTQLWPTEQDFVDCMNYFQPLLSADKKARLTQRYVSSTMASAAKFITDQALNDTSKILSLDKLVLQINRLIPIRRVNNRKAMDQNLIQFFTILLNEASSPDNFKKVLNTIQQTIPDFFKQLWPTSQDFIEYITCFEPLLKDQKKTLFIQFYLARFTDKKNALQLILDIALNGKPPVPDINILLMHITPTNLTTKVHEALVLILTTWIKHHDESVDARELLTKYQFPDAVIIDVLEKQKPLTTKTAIILVKLLKEKTTAHRIFNTMLRSTEDVQKALKTIKQFSSDSSVQTEYPLAEKITAGWNTLFAITNNATIPATAAPTPLKSAYEQVEKFEFSDKQITDILEKVQKKEIELSIDILRQFTRQAKEKATLQWILALDDSKVWDKGILKTDLVIGKAARIWQLKDYIAYQERKKIIKKNSFSRSFKKVFRRLFFKSWRWRYSAERKIKAAQEQLSKLKSSDSNPKISSQSLSVLQVGHIGKPLTPCIPPLKKIPETHSIIEKQFFEALSNITSSPDVFKKTLDTFQIKHPDFFIALWPKFQDLVDFLAQPQLTINAEQKNQFMALYLTRFEKYYRELSAYLKYMMTEALREEKDQSNIDVLFAKIDQAIQSNAPQKIIQMALLEALLALSLKNPSHLKKIHFFPDEIIMAILEKPELFTPENLLNVLTTQTMEKVTLLEILKKMILKSHSTESEFAWIKAIFENSNDENSVAYKIRSEFSRQYPSVKNIFDAFFVNSAELSADDFRKKLDSSQQDTPTFFTQLWPSLQDFIDFYATSSSPIDAKRQEHLIDVFLTRFATRKNAMQLIMTAILHDDPKIPNLHAHFDKIEKLMAPKVNATMITAEINNALTLILQAILPQDDNASDEQISRAQLFMANYQFPDEVISEIISPLPPLKKLLPIVTTQDIKKGLLLWLFKKIAAEFKEIEKGLAWMKAITDACTTAEKLNTDIVKMSKGYHVLLSFLDLEPNRNNTQSLEEQIAKLEFSEEQIKSIVQQLHKKEISLPVEILRQLARQTQEKKTLQWILAVDDAKVMVNGIPKIDLEIRKIARIWQLKHYVVERTNEAALTPDVPLSESYRQTFFGSLGFDAETKIKTAKKLLTFLGTTARRKKCTSEEIDVLNSGRLGEQLEPVVPGQ